MIYRVLRSIKNRYGSTNEICIMEMSSSGLKEIKNPSEIFLDRQLENTSGSCIACLIEGNRPFFVEIQALVIKSYSNIPKRITTGFDFNRLCLILAILEKRMKLYFSNKDVYMNIIGGFRLNEPSADLAVAISLISALKNTVIDKNLVAFGEIDLSGKVRSAPRYSVRINEIDKLGFKNCITCVNNDKSDLPIKPSLNIIEVKNIDEIIKYGNLDLN